MINILKHIANCAEKLPDEPSSAVKDPNPLRRMINHLNRGLQLTRLCLNYYANPEKHDPKLYWRDWKSGEAKGTRPWKTYTTQLWQKHRTALHGIWIGYYDRLSLAQDSLKDECAYRTAEFFYILSLHLLACQYRTMSLEEQEEIGRMRAQDFVCVDTEALAPHTGIMSLYSMKQLMDTLFALASRINEVPYSTELLRYFEVLEWCAAAFVLFPRTSIAHDVEPYRAEIETSEDKYSVSEKFISHLSVIASSLRRKFGRGAPFPRVTPDPKSPIFGVDVELRAACKAWFARRAARLTAKASSEWLEQLNISMSLWPGEKEIYALDFPTAICTDLSVLKKYRGDTFKKMMLSGERPVREIIQEELYSDGRESLVLMLALMDISSLHIRHAYSSVDWSQYAVFETDVEIQYEGFTKEEYPRLVQAFNYFQLYCNGSIIEYNSYVDSWIAWWRAMFAFRDGALSKRITLHQLAEEIFGVDLCRRRIQNFEQTRKKHLIVSGKRKDKEDSASLMIISGKGFSFGGAKSQRIGTTTQGAT